MMKLNKIIVDRKKIDINKSGNYFLEIKDVSDIDIIINPYLEVSLFYIDTNKVSSRTINYKILDNSKLSVNKFYNKKSCLENININLDGFNSSIKYYFSGLSSGDEKYNMVINHNNKNVCSEVINHMVALDGASYYFNIDSNVANGNKGCVMNQVTKIINLGDNKSVIKPNMNIREYDVKASHGSVIGEFREEDLFYLMSRGINYNAAMKLLVRGFLLVNIKNNLEFVENINNIVDKYWR